jgi:hypothetical protein
MKLLGFLFLAILTNQIVMGIGTPENATNVQFNASAPIFSDEMVIGISQNATGIGMQSAINFGVKIHNNGSTIARELNITLSTTTPEIQILPTSNFEFSELEVNSSLTLDVSADLTSSEITQTVDLVLIVDASGSMGEEIASVQQELTGLIDTLSIEIPDLRIGVIIYGSTRYSEYPMSSTYNYLDLTTDFDNIKYLINSFNAGGGTEPWGDALYLAETFTWRETAQKLIILVGDEDCDPGRIIGNGVSGSWYNGTELLSIVTQLKEIGVIINTVVCENPDDHVTHQFQWISEFTSGTSVFLPDLLNGETPITLPQIIQEWTLELSREHSNWFLVDITWVDIDGNLLKTNGKSHFWLDLSFPSLTYYEKVIPIGKDLFDVHFYVEALDFSNISYVAIYHDGYASSYVTQGTTNRGGGTRGSWSVSQMGYDNVTSLYTAVINDLPKGYNLSFFFECADILSNFGKTENYWISVDYQTKLLGERSILPISPGESIITQLDVESDNSIMLWVTSETNLTDISIKVSYAQENGYSSSQPLSELHQYNGDLQMWYRVLEYSLTLKPYILNLTVPESYNDSFLVQFTWLQPILLENDSITTKMTDRIKTHLYRWSVSEPENFVVDYTPYSDLVVGGYVFQLNWTYVGKFSVLEALNVTEGTYYVLIDTSLRTGEYRVILTDDIPNVTDLYYTRTNMTMASGASGYQFPVLLLTLLSLAVFIKRSGKKNKKHI